MANPRYNKQTTNRRGAMGGGMMRKKYLTGGQVKLDKNKRTSHQSLLIYFFILSFK